jgi:uncharacterized UPF0160 family protein
MAESIEQPVRIITHSGTFHADELFACAAILIFLDGKPYEIIRTRDHEVIETGDYVVDVGGIYDPAINRFDHHQHGGAGVRDGVPYSSFGLVWKHFGEAICGSKEVALSIEHRLVYSVDMGDNGVETYTPVRPDVHPYLLHSLVMAYRPTWKEGALQDVRFAELVPLVRTILEREIICEQDRIEGALLVRAAYERTDDKRIIVLEGGYPWQAELTKYTEPLYVVKPKNQGANWEVECVRNDVRSFTNRKSLLEAWRGKFDEELALATGVPDAVFCHNTGFVAVAGSREGALKLAELARDA